MTTSSLNVPIEKFGNELNRFRYGLKYYDVNYGKIEIDWEQADPEITMSVCGVDGETILQVPLKLSKLEPTFGLTP